MSVDWERLKVRDGMKLMAFHINNIIDAVAQALENVNQNIAGAIRYTDLVKLASSIIPDQNNTRDLGSSDRQWRNLYAVNGYFSGNLLVQGKQVIKDGDPVNIGDIFDTARDKITQAINNALVTQSIQAMLSRLDVQLSSRASESTLSNILSRLDVELSTRASESTLQSILNRLDIELSTRASESTLQSILSRLNTNLDTRASESTLTSILTLLTNLLTSSGNTRIALVETTIKQPVDIQDHLSESLTILTHGSRTSSGSGSDVDVARFIVADVCVDVTSVSGTSPVLSVYIEGRQRTVGKYRVLLAFENITTPTFICGTINPLAYSLIRARWVISGTSPSFAFSVVGEFKS